MFVSDEVEDFTLSERGHLVAVLSMAVEETVDFYVAVKQNERVVLVGAV